jgi:predicted TIM-barrel enzyme
MSAKLSTLATNIAANAAAVATAITGVTTADATALADLLKTMSLDNSHTVPLLMKSGLSNPNTALTPG